MSDMIQGGPAFPNEGSEGSALRSWPGMTLREYYAGQAIAGLLAADGTASKSHVDLAFEAFQIADKMIKEAGYDI